MFACYRAERSRATLAKRSLVQLHQHATAADTCEYLKNHYSYIYTYLSTYFSFTCINNLLIGYDELKKILNILVASIIHNLAIV